MVGFAAATYMRGIDFVQCPTSLLSMVDASVGGKTGVDMPQGKNLVGAFKQPTAVFADIATLTTLPQVELASGMAEVIKHGLIEDIALFHALEQDDWSLESDSFQQNLQKLVTQAIRVKIAVVQEDPFEQGKRATLNLGHTFGHAIEQLTEFAVRHGEGVAMGLVAAANLSARLGYCAPDLQTRIEAVLKRANLPTCIPAHLDPEQLYTIMHSDKKAAAGRVRFILMRDVGDVFLDGDVSETAVFQSIRAVQI
jgi:3-dehydroquinate synthase